MRADREWGGGLMLRDLAGCGVGGYDLGMAKWKLHFRFSLTSIFVAMAAIPLGVGFVLAIDDLAWINAFVFLGYPPAGPSRWGTTARDHRDCAARYGPP